MNNGAFDGQKFYVENNNPPTLFALDARTGNIAWQVPLPAVAWGPITLANGVGIVPTGNQIRVFNTDDGGTLFEFTAAATVGSGVAIANGRIFFGAGVNWTGTTPGDAFYAFAVPGAP